MKLSSKRHTAKELGRAGPPLGATRCRTGSFSTTAIEPTPGLVGRKLDTKDEGHSPAGTMKARPL